MSRPLSPYRVLPANLPLEFRFETRFKFESTGPDPRAQAITGVQYSLGTDSDWSADAHDLIIKCFFEGAPELGSLFGGGGLAAPDAELLLVLEWTSADSGWRTLGTPLRLTSRGLSPQKETNSLLLELPSGSVRGSGMLSVQLLLGYPGSSHPDGSLANQMGARFGALSASVEIAIDGDGSLFPVQEEALGPDGALWELRAAWSDPLEEPFASEYVALVLNRDHELFDQLRERRTAPGRQTPLMRHVLSSWIALLVHKIKSELGHEFDAIVNSPRQAEDFASIAEATAGFVRAGELDTATLNGLFASAQRWLDRRIRETEPAE